MLRRHIDNTGYEREEIRIRGDEGREGKRYKGSSSPILSLSFLVNVFLFVIHSTLYSSLQGLLLPPPETRDNALPAILLYLHSELSVFASLSLSLSPLLIHHPTLLFPLASSPPLFNFLSLPLLSLSLSVPNLLKYFHFPHSLTLFQFR